MATQSVVDGVSAEPGIVGLMRGIQSTGEAPERQVAPLRTLSSVVYRLVLSRRWQRFGDKRDVNREAHRRVIRISPGQLFDLAQAIGQRIAVDAERGGCLSVRAAGVEIRQ